MFRTYSSAARRAAVVFAFALLVLVGGCGGPPKLHGDIAATGRVTYDGKDIEEGVVTFRPLDGVGLPQSGTIQGGQYTVEKLMPGLKQVIVTGRIPGTNRPLPPDVHGNSEPMMVRADATTGLDIRLLSKPPPKK